MTPFSPGPQLMLLLHLQRLNDPAPHAAFAAQPATRVPGPAQTGSAGDAAADGGAADGGAAVLPLPETALQRSRPAASAA